MPKFSGISINRQSNTITLRLGQIIPSGIDAFKKKSSYFGPIARVRYIASERQNKRAISMQSDGNTIKS